MSDEFRLVKKNDPPAPAEALAALRVRRTAEHLTDHHEAATYYEIDDGLETAINMALAVGQPLLVTGEPGTGKTQLAYYLGRYFGIAVRPFLVKSTTTARDLQYDFDAVGYLQSAYATREQQLQGEGAEEGGEARAAKRESFLEKGPLWRAYEDEHPSVLLIDEIDKAPRDFPNDLLHELDQGWFPHPFQRDGSGEPLKVPGGRSRPPIVVITSNVERRLPGPFLRRCVFHHIELTRDLVRKAVQRRAGEFPALPPAVREAAFERFWELRTEGRLDKPPSTAELLVWLAVLNALQVDEEKLKPDSDLPALGCLLKSQEDLAQLRGK